ncbi:GtrA family protein [Mastigocladus laminosus UU774]|nr:GtrA family protein [Mastigocladus laminosus UU774]
MKTKHKFIRYAIVGVLGTSLHTGVLVLLVEVFSTPPLLSTSAGFIASFIASYLLNYKWTFRSKGKHINTLIRYSAVSLSGFILNLTIMFLIVDIFSLWYMIGQIISIIVVPVSNFILNSRWAFKR